MDNSNKIAEGLAQGLGALGESLNSSLEQLLKATGGKTSYVTPEERELVADLRHTLGGMNVRGVEDLEKLADNLLNLKNRAKDAM